MSKKLDKEDKPKQVILAPASPKQLMVVQDEETDTLLCGGGAGEKVAPISSNIYKQTH